MNTIKSNISFSGVGIHSGELVTMVLIPTDKPGITFKLNNEIISANIDAIADQQNRSTSISNGTCSIFMTEHFLAACYALSLTNIVVEISSHELPILDGSSIEYIEKILPNLIDAPIKPEYLDIECDITFEHDGSYYVALPSNSLTISGYLSYPSCWLKSLSYTYQHSCEDFINKIAPARTYGFEDEIAQLKLKNLAKGGSLDNALVITHDGYMNKPRFDNEIVRHKILDFIGDIALSNKQLRGNFILIKPSHQGNCQFIKHLGLSQNTIKF